MKQLLHISIFFLLNLLDAQSQAPPAAPGHVQLAPGREAVFRYPTIARLNDDRLLCVYSKEEKNNFEQYRIVVEGIFSDDHGISWSKPVILIDADPSLSLDASIVVTSKAVIVNSTVVPKTHYKFVSTSKTMAVRSEDNGKTWSEVYEIPINHRYVAGKINPGVTLDNGVSFFPYAWDKGLQTKAKISGDNEQNCISGLMLSIDGGLSWKQGPQFMIRKKKTAKNAINGLDEPAIVKCPDGSLYMLFRTGFDRLYESRSRNGGKTWSAPGPSALKSHDAPAALCEVTGDSPAILAVWNNSENSRWPLAAAMSFDNGKSWTSPKVIAEYPGYQSSYPGCVQAADGTIVIVWQQNHADRPRTIEMKRITAAWLVNDRAAE
ncbi:MAG: exo-alpha-sialidase [Chitinophagaceae bacterium]|nr:exo-alpha-sialidase [Chitinophagaceae bacterium]